MNARQMIWPLLALLGLGILPAGARADNAPPPSAPASVVGNGDFAQWQAAPAALQQKINCPQVPAGWFVWATGPTQTCSVARDTEVKPSGDCSVRLTATDSNSGLTVAQRMDVAPEMRYVLRVWFKGDKIEDYNPQGLNVLLVCSTQTDKRDQNTWAGILNSVYKPPAPSRGTFDWTELVATVDTPKDTKTLMLDIFMHGAGTAWVGEVSVTPLEKCLQVEDY